MKVLFICTENCSRSAIAEAYFKHLCEQNNLSHEVITESAGIAVPEEVAIPEEAQELMKNLELSLEHHVPRQVSAEQVESANNVICMTAEHKDFILKNFAAEAAGENKVRLLLSFLETEDDIDAPHTGDIETFEQCFLSMMPALANLADRIIRSAH
ncbi:MAG: hypothetical protein NE334_11480 [Lentisphaeraceae bacterium]|nr:hypothetical protein [Lentisphaeraceae bacterium]